MKVTAKKVITTLKSVTLELNQEEVEFLRDVFNMIGGDPVNSRRRISAQMIETLRQAGMNVDATGDTNDRQGSLYFLDAKDIENRKKTTKKKVWDSRWDDEVPF